jgi:hypothetical protein
LVISFRVLRVDGNGANETPSVSQVLVKPDNPVRGGAIQFVVLGDFDAKTVAATLFGPAPCDKGCELKINGEKRADRITGQALMPYYGELQIEVRNGDGTPAKRVPFCTVAAPRISADLDKARSA